MLFCDNDQLTAFYPIQIKLIDYSDIKAAIYNTKHNAQAFRIVMQGDS